MVQAIENRSRVWCVPAGPPTPGPAPGWSTLEVAVRRTAPISGRADLLGDAPGREYTAIVPPAVMDELAGHEIWVVEAEVVGPHRIAVRATAADEG